jgi:predicted acetyltransferase
MDLVVRVDDVDLEQKAVVGRLLEFNAYEFSRFDGADVESDGTFGCRYLDDYWADAERHALLMRADDAIAGVALVRVAEIRTIAEFLVLPKYRRRHVGIAAARIIFRMFPGAWEVHEVSGNEEAVTFWRRAIPVEFTETTDETGTTQRFRVSN